MQGTRIQRCTPTRKLTRFSLKSRATVFSRRGVRSNFLSREPKQPRKIPRNKEIAHRLHQSNGESGIGIGLIFTELRAKRCSKSHSLSYSPAAVGATPISCPPFDLPQEVLSAIFRAQIAQVHCRTLFFPVLPGGARWTTPKPSHNPKSDLGFVFRIPRNPDLQHFGQIRRGKFRLLLRRPNLQTAITFQPLVSAASKTDQRCAPSFCFFSHLRLHRCFLKCRDNWKNAWGDFSNFLENGCFDPILLPANRCTEIARDFSLPSIEPINPIFKEIQAFF